MRPTRPYAGLPVVPCGYKVMADCRVSHHTSPCFFWWAYILYDILYGIFMSCSTTKMMFPSLPPPERVVPIVGIVATSNGRTCDVHRFGCGNALLMGLPAHGCGVLLRLKKTPSGDLAAHFVLSDGSDGCRVAFAPREHAVGPRGCFLDGVLVRMIEVYTAEHPNGYCRLLYHRNCGYGLAEIVVDGNN